MKTKRAASEYRLGEFRLSVISDGVFWLDGGAVFGVVPRVLWERVAPPDEKNRVRLGLNALLVRTGRENVLIDTGIGDKWDEKRRRIYSLTQPPTLITSLAERGLEPEDIDVVINTHLHFDHCGWNTRYLNGSLRPTFPRARYIVQRGEYEHAQHPHERDRASYDPENWAGLEERGQLELIDGDRTIVPGIEVVKLCGHNRDFQCVFVRSRGETAVFWSDLVPMTPHVQFPWIMAFDLYPEQTLMHKKRLIPQAAREGWFCVFHHDPEIPVGRIIEEDGQYRVDRWTV
ncbi:MAG: MBL fold metallo-hydrolase [Acidobacteria bacterium]|nr:MAG: MBL fold metallo-hydrolase [Acidobacteriota bacterium]